ncbi:MAG: formate dehydrogenase accessory sulfurtransferase FdhD [Bacteroidetes bacterium]|nr:formate dehydrogenase accessory sulfurtransferase FdhD [Bacteroidota bacterium]
MSNGNYKILKVQNGITNEADDTAAIEEPLEISIVNCAEKKVISITMRTPGNDEELAAGFLFTEGIIKDNCVKSFSKGMNTVTVHIEENAQINLKSSDRNFYMTSSCGICGKSSIDSVRTNSKYKIEISKNVISKDTILKLPEILRKHQSIFDSTGGLHASGLFDLNGNFIALKEDVGRHNALDKLAGYALQNNLLALSNNILLLSGRASFELIQKALMIGIPVVCAVGAPSSLAIDLAKENNITLIGFLRDNRFNIYSYPERIKLNEE